MLEVTLTQVIGIAAWYVKRVIPDHWLEFEQRARTAGC